MEKKLFFAAVLGGLVVLLGSRIVEPNGPSALTPRGSPSGFEKVVAQRQLRCAYAAYDPMFIIGPDKSLSGIFHDVVEEAAKRLSLKVIWTEEVGYGNINTGFATGRYDAFCAGLWPAGSRAATTIFSQPVAWDPVGIWVRMDDARFDGRIADLDDPSHKIAVIDGDATVAMANALFPKAGRTQVAQNQSITEEVMQVTTSKADAVFQDYITADKFMSSAPNSLKNLSPDHPVLIYPLTIGFNQGETALRDMVDVVLGDMERDGTVQAIIARYMGSKANLLFHEERHFQPD